MIRAYIRRIFMYRVYKTLAEIKLNITDGQKWAKIILAIKSQFFFGKVCSKIAEKSLGRSTVIVFSGRLELHNTQWAKFPLEVQLRETVLILAFQVIVRLFVHAHINCCSIFPFLVQCDIGTMYMMDIKKELKIG